MHKLMLDKTSEKKKEVVSYKRDESGHLMCHLCSFKPKPTQAHPLGNPSTLHYHLKKKHDGNCEHVCKTCGYAFLHKIALDTHIASRHPELNQKVEMFRCPIDGCQYESLTLGNLEIHKARKHYPNVVSKNLQMVELENKKMYKCLCCQENYKSSSAFHYHIMKDLLTHQTFTA